MASRLTLPPVLDAGEMRAAEAALFAGGIDPLDLMERAGAAAARAVLAFASPRDVVVACGTGNNGGDGYVAARHLAIAGVAVRVAATGEPATANARAMAARWGGAVEPIASAKPANVLVDAVFGIGLSRPVEPGLAGELARLAAAAHVVVALDVPSGLFTDDGGGESIAADLTVSFGALKPVHLLAAARCGRVVVADIGIDASRARTWGTAPPPSFEPAADSYKYARGAVLTLGGPAGQGGAARLAARAALRGGAGLSMIACPAGALAENAARLDAVMVREADDAAAVTALLARHRFAAIAAGPGLGDGRARLGAVLASGLPLVLDADVFTLFAGDPAGLAAALAGPAVLTPHEGEFVRLFGDLPGSRLDRVRAAAAKVGAVVLLKGAATVIAAPDGRAAINTHATPWLATAGSGDVLTGVIAACLAQGYDAFDAACAGAWLHGDAGRRCGAGLIAEDLPEAVAAALAGL
ncbi:NAD(P)H-hydrate dehydratase [Polymorphobacter sp. PAMC 29334]|uniref:NAD(P)H-hydrate dehydratase n=1 Tax=Polymorphobacter sp. PAMC 29334 TaxID=2862331 RepID=UPI001C76997F|nr:NAD(P)H-hydrate dehydratase [Polymorphobacter sp. PAMC 29334]QYE34264.1 NAD(P)H-hydrate dehydratase [Polymorphobacter sp. PAMC 29334]